MCLCVWGEGDGYHHLGEAMYLCGGFQKIVVPQNGWFIMEIFITMDDLGVPLFSETPMYSIFK